MNVVWKRPVLDGRLEFTPSEAVAIGKLLEELERDNAKNRQKATQAGNAPRNKQGQVTGGAVAAPPVEPREKGKTIDKVSSAVGGESEGGEQQCEGCRN